MGRLRLLCLLIAIAMLGCGADDGASEPEPSPPTPCDELEQLLDEGIAEMMAPGATLAVSTPDQGLCARATGLADRASERAMVAEDRFGIGSITKTFTAAVVLQLRDEGVLALDDALEDWYPGFPRGDQIKLENLLRHTTGIADVAYNPIVWADVSKTWDPVELVGLAADEPPVFDVGATYGYSNTNFILLGLVIEAATGDTWEHQVRTRLLDPVGLSDTFIPTTEEIPGGSEGVAHGYFVNDDWTTYLSPTTGWAAGAILSNGPDLVRWLAALLEGDVLSEGSRADMKSPTELPGGNLVSYGMGLDLRSWGSGYGNLQGHTGDAIIYRAEAFRLPERDVTVVVLINAFNEDTGLIADAIWDQVAPPEG